MQLNVFAENNRLDEKFDGVVYPKTKKIGCVLLQSIFGGQSALCSLFDTVAWETGDTKNAKMAKLTMSEWKRLASHYNNHHREERGRKNIN